MSTNTSKRQEKKILRTREITFDGILRAEDVQVLTGLSRVTIWREEREGRFPARVQLTGNRVGWYGNEIKAWIDSRPRVDLAPEIENGETIAL